MSIWLPGGSGRNAPKVPSAAVVRSRAASPSITIFTGAFLTGWFAVTVPLQIAPGPDILASPGSATSVVTDAVSATSSSRGSEVRFPVEAARV